MKEVELLKKLIKDEVLNLNACLIKYYQKLNINEMDVILLFYLVGLDSKNFNRYTPATIKKDTKLSIEDVYRSTERLSNLNYLKISSIKDKETSKNIEIFSLDNFYQKIVELYVEPKKENTELTDNFYSLIGNLYEELFHKQMSALDADIVRCWEEENKFSFEEIKSEMLDMAKIGKTSLKSVDQSLIKKRIIKEQSPEYIETNKIIEDLKTKWKK